MKGCKFLSNVVLTIQTHLVFLVCSVCCCHESVFSHNPLFLFEEIDRDFQDSDAIPRLSP